MLFVKIKVSNVLLCKWVAMVVDGQHGSQFEPLIKIN